MSRYRLIKVIKRVAREQSRSVDGVARAELSAHEKPGEQAEAVKNWISEFRQTRQTRYLELKQQFGWPQDGGKGIRH